MKRKLFSILAILMMALTAHATGYRVIGTAINPPSTVPSDFKEVTEAEAWAYGHSFTGTVCWLVIYAKDGNNYKFVRKAEWGENNGTNTWENIIYGESGCYPDPSQVSLIVPYEDAVTVTGVTLSQAEATLNIGETLTLTATVLPANATDQTVTWASSDPAVATVAEGVVTAVGAGTATITATATNGTDVTTDDHAATCAVTVASAVQVRELTRNAEGNWVLSGMPDWSGRLVVTFYEQYRLDSIPMTWTITVNGADRSAQVTAYTAEEGPDTLGWLMVYAGAAVELVPPTAVKPTVKEVELVNNSIPPTVDLEATTTAWADGSRLAVPAGGLTYNDAITVTGDVTLVLTDGETLTLNKGISLAAGATLTVEGNGTMNVNGTSGSIASTVAGTGTLVLTSGTLNAKGGNGNSTPDAQDDNTGADGGVGINGAVTVAGGTLTATGGNGGNCGKYADRNKGGAGGAAISGDVTMTSGTLTATGGNGGDAGLYGDQNTGGAGGAAINGALIINGGTVTTTNGNNGGGGSGGFGNTVVAGGKAVAGTVTDNRN